MAPLSPPRKRQRAVDDNARNPFLSLPHDVLRLVLARLDLLDHIRLGAACKSLRLLAMRDNPPSTKPLWRVRNDDPAKLLRSFHALPIKYKLRRPARARASTRCLGCYEGWLVLEEIGSPRKKIYAYNRISGSRINFPRLRNVCKVVLSSDPSSHDCTVAAMHDFNRIAICRPRRERPWTVLSRHGKERIGALDLVFCGYDGGNNNNSPWLWVMFTDGIYGIDLHRSPLSLERLNVGLPTRSPDFSSLVVFSTKLLLATACMDPARERTCDLGLICCLWELAPSNMAFVEADGLEDGVLFLGSSHSGYVPVHKLGSLCGGSVYMGRRVCWTLRNRVKKSKNTETSEEEKVEEASKCVHWKLFP